MNINGLSREEKEKLYIEKMGELQIRWGNPTDSSWDFIHAWTDEELEQDIKDTISQLYFEKTLSVIKQIFLFAISSIIILGVLGLILFGVRQIF